MYRKIILPFADIITIRMVNAILGMLYSPSITYSTNNAITFKLEMSMDSVTINAKIFA